MYTGVEIAIIGLAGRFPGAADLTQFWDNIRTGREAVETLDDNELTRLGVPPELRNDPNFVPCRLPFEGLDQFDAGYFGYTPREATQLDPQQRLFLETAVTALDHAGYGQAAGLPVGVYAGCGANLYLLRELLPGLDLQQADIASLLGLMNGNDKDSLASRVAYKLDLRGPAVTVQTACSSSLVAVHQACRALLAYECDIALAGGIFLNLLPQGGYRYQAGAILSADGHCRAFDVQASGTLLGSGCGLVVLKRLEEALADGDTIHAVIKGSAVNNDGANKVGYTAPSVDGQAEVILAAQTFADVAPDTIGYVEAHGTGTVLGDPIEVAALAQAFRQGSARRGYCALGSVKTQIGHLDAAAGVAGLIRTVLALMHRTLPPSLNFATPNPQIDFADSPFYVNTVAAPWQAGNTPRRAGVSSFGMGGTNAHVIVEEAPPPFATVAAGDAVQLLPLSARSAAALTAAQAQLAATLATADHALADIAHTLQLGRKAHAWRSVVLADSPAAAALALNVTASPQVVSGQAREGLAIALLFPGQGAQHAGMGRALYDSEPVYRAAVDDCCHQLQPWLGLDLRTLLHADPDDQTASAALQETRYTQPALFVTSYALAKLWQSVDITPHAMLGHSVGEYVAATLAGVFSLPDALRLIAARGRLLHDTADGAMLAVGLSEAELVPYLGEGVDLAAVNAPQLCVLAGTPAAIAAREQQLAGHGISVRRLQVGRAFHSALTEPVLADFARELASITLHAPSRPFVSNVTGRWIGAADASDPAYWVRHIRATVRFADGLATLLSTPHVLLESGPGDTLSVLARRHPQAAQAVVVPSQCHPRHLAGNATQWHSARAQLWVHGAPQAVLGQAQGRRVPLPGYPFQRQRYWAEPAQATVPGTAPSPSMSSDAFGPARWFHLPDWQRLPAAGPATPGDEPVRRVLLLGEPSKLRDALVNHWLGSGATVLHARAAAGFTELGHGQYGVRPDSRDDLLAVLHAAQAEGALSDIVHLWSVHDSVPAPELAWRDGFHGLLALAQALADASASALRLTVLANHLEDVTGSEALCAEKAAVLGAVKVIPQEYPQLVCRLIELGDCTLREPAGWLSSQLAQAVAAVDTPALQSWRGRHRWHKQWREAPPPAAAPRLTSRGCYVIVGGLGGIGLALAHHLAQDWQARLVLLSRRGLAPPEDWPASGHDARIDAVRALQALGSEVLVLAADVADAASLEQALATVRHRFGAIAGVIHAAGEPGGGMIPARERVAVERVLAPKVAGSRNLLQALAAAPPDFILLCSSLSAITGGYGQIDYSAANAVQDALAHVARRHALPVLAVNWDTWREVGMAALHQHQDGHGIAPQQAGELLQRLLATPEAQIAVSTRPMAEQFAHWASLQAAARMLAEPPRSAARQARPPLATSYAAPKLGLEADLAELWSAFLGIDPIGVNDSLFELGGDSLLAIQLLAKVRQQYDVEVHPAAFFKCPTVAELAWLTESRLIEAIETETPPAGITD